MFTGKRETGFSIPPPKGSGQQQQQGFAVQGQRQGEPIPYHANVLPVKASPKDTGGFGDDAFKPLWEGSAQQKQKGFNTGK
jgi:hypothetical protein